MQELSYLGKASVKKKYITRMTGHIKADELVHGQYWEDGKGCAVACIIHGSSHAKFEKELGVPEWCARLIDTLFEGLQNGESKKFPLAFLKAIPVGKNEAWWNQIKWRFCAFVLKENIERVLALENISEELKKQVVDAIRGCLKLHETAAETGEWDTSAAWSAESAAWSAASAARSAASAASAAWSAASAAWSAAWSAESAARSAESAAWSAASAAWSAARSAAYSRYANELVRLLKVTK